MSLRDRIGIDVGRRLRLEEALEWAAEHEVRWIDIQLDAGSNALSSFDDARAAGVRRACERYGVHLGLHTASAVNVAEVAPYVGDAVERYLEAYVEIAPRLGAEWIVMHAGFHFTSDKERRMAAGLERLKRIVGHAERRGALVLLENLNKEPDEAEIHYLAHTIEEWRYYFDAIQSPAFKLSFTVNHAHLVPEGIAGFVDTIDMGRVEEVRLADCFRNGHEVHLKPGAGDLILPTCSGGSRARASVVTTRTPLVPGRAKTAGGEVSSGRGCRTVPIAGTRRISAAVVARRLSRARSALRTAEPR